MKKAGLKSTTLWFHRSRSWAAAIVILLASCNDNPGGGGGSGGSHEGGGGSHEQPPEVGVCANPIALDTALPLVVAGSTQGRPDTMTTGCIYSPSAPEAVHSFTAPTSGTFIFEASGVYNPTTGVTFDPVLYLRDGDCSGAELGCTRDPRDPLDSPPHYVSVSLVAGQTVYVVVDGRFGQVGDYQLGITQLEEEGSCSAPIHLGSVVPAGVIGDTTRRPQTHFTTCGFSYAPEMVYTFTAPHAGVFTFTVLASPMQAVLTLHVGTCSGPQLECSCSLSDTPTYVDSWLDMPLAAGQTVALVIQGTRDTTGNFSLSITENRVSCPSPPPPAPPPSNGTCSAPIDLGSTSPQSFTGSTVCHPNSVTRGCYGAYGPDVVHTFTARGDGMYIFAVGTSAPLPSSGFAPSLSVFEGDCSGSMIGCGPRPGMLPFEPNPSEVMTWLTTGQVVSIAVDGVGNTAGEYSLYIY